MPGRRSQPQRPMQIDSIIRTEAAHMCQDSGQILAHSKRTLRRDLRARRGQLSKKLRTRNDMLLMPLVGYDRFGNRLGMGAGYYDRCLESLSDLATPLRVGIAYSLQEIDPVAKNKWDIPLHGLVNEHGWFTFVGEEPLTRF